MLSIRFPFNLLLYYPSFCTPHTTLPSSYLNFHDGYYILVNIGICKISLLVLHSYLSIVSFYFDPNIWCNIFLSNIINFFSSPFVVDHGLLAYSLIGDKSTVQNFSFDFLDKILGLHISLNILRQYSKHLSSSVLSSVMSTTVRIYAYSKIFQAC